MFFRVSFRGVLKGFKYGVLVFIWGDVVFRVFLFGNFEVIMGGGVFGI